MAKIVFYGVLTRDIYHELPEGVIQEDNMLSGLMRADAPDKVTLVESSFNYLRKIIGGFFKGAGFGGSNVNVAVIVAAVLGNTHLWTTLPTGRLGQEAKLEFQQCGLDLVRNNTGYHVIGVSENLVLERVQATDRVIAKNQNNDVNARFNEEPVPEDLVASADVNVLQGSMLHRSPEVFNDVVAKAKEGSELYLTAPTDIEYIEKHPEVRERIKEFFLNKAMVIAANRKELEATFGMDLPAISKLIYRHWQSLNDGKQRLLMVTDGPKDAHYISQVSGVGNMPSYASKIQNLHMRLFKTGAGDLAFAGLIVGRQLGLKDRDAVALAMLFGFIKTIQQSYKSYITDPITQVVSMDRKYGGEISALAQQMMETLQPDQPRLGKATPVRAVQLIR